MLSRVARNRLNVSMHVPLALLFTAACVSGCSTLGPLGNVFGGDGTKPAGSASEGTFYTGTAGVKLYAEPHFASSPIGTLPLHQKVHRLELTRGFAYVRVDGSGQTGWVDNGKLIWRLPHKPAAAIESTAPDTTSAPATEPVAKEAPPAPEESMEVEAPAMAEEAPTEASPPEATKDVDPSVFNPF